MFFAWGCLFLSRYRKSCAPGEIVFQKPNTPLRARARPTPCISFVEVSHISFCLQQGFPVILAGERSESPPTAPRLWLLSRLCLVPWILICSLGSVAETRTRPCMCGSLFIKINLCGSPPLLVCLKPKEKNIEVGGMQRPTIEPVSKNTRRPQRRSCRLATGDLERQEPRVEALASLCFRCAVRSL